MCIEYIPLYTYILDFSYRKTVCIISLGVCSPYHWEICCGLHLYAPICKTRHCFSSCHNCVKRFCFWLCVWVVCVFFFSSFHRNMLLFSDFYSLFSFVICFNFFSCLFLALSLWVYVIGKLCTFFTSTCKQRACICAHLNLVT